MLTIVSEKAETEPNIRELLARVAALHQEAAEAAGKGDLERVDALTTEVAAIRRQVERVRRPPRRSTTGAGRTSARSQALMALDDMGVAAPPREIARFNEVRFGVDLDVRALASVRRDERKAFDRQGPGRATPYLVPALDVRLLQPVRGPLTLSSWALERRLLAPTSPRVDHLRLTRRLAELARDLGGEQGNRVLGLAGSYARSVTGALGRADLDPAAIIEAADAELAEIAGFDDQERARGAKRARAQLRPDELLWGWEDRPGLQVIAGGGESG
jgi:hypothetical protein